MTTWPERLRRLTAAEGPRHAVWKALDAEAERDPEAARDLGHMLLQVSWSQTQTNADGHIPEAEKWLRRAVARRPGDAEATLLLATLLSTQCGQLWDVALGTRHPKRWNEERKRRAVEACDLYERALHLDPRSSAAASGLALLREAPGLTGRDHPALGRATDLDRTGSRDFDYFVVRVELLVTNNGDTVTRWIVLRDLDQLWGLETCAGEISKPVAFHYERGVQVASHRPARLSGRSLSQVAGEWLGERSPASRGTPLPVGHPVRHDGEALQYGVNGAQMADGPL